MREAKRDLLKLNTYLDLKRQAVGVKFLLEEEDFEAAPEPSIQGKRAYCTMVRDAMKGQRLKARLENFACLSAAKALGMMEVTSQDHSGSGRVKIGTYKNLGVGRSVSKDMVYCQHQSVGVSIAPLDQCESEPDVVLLVTEPYNAMRLIQGYAYHRGQVKDIKLAGMQAICQECTSYPFEKNDLSVSMLCAGTRLLAQWEPSEMAVSMPYAMLHEVVDGLEKTVNPIERNKNKARIEARMRENDLQELTIVYNQNYDDGLYTGL